MTYSELLSEYIEKSGLSLGEISKRMYEEKGVKVDRSYISMLKNNKTKNPASDEINRALAEVTGGDPDKLIMKAYIEKAPKEIKPLISHYLNNIDTYIFTLAVFFADEKETIEETAEKVKSVMDSVKSMPMSEEKIDFIISHFNQIVKNQPKFIREYGKQSGVPDEIIESTIDTAINKPLNRIKVLDLKNESSYTDWISASKIGFGEYVYIIAFDDSMIGSNIQEGSKLLCRFIREDEQENYEVESGKIYVVGLKEEVFIRRIYVDKKDPNRITLQSENPRYAPITVDRNKDDFEFVALVKSVEVNLNQ